MLVANDLQNPQEVSFSKTSIAQYQNREEGKLFTDKQNSDLYWEALVQVANNHKSEAEQLVSTIRSNPYAVILPKWKASQPKSIDAAFDKLFLATVYRNPETLSYLGLFESIGILDHNAYLRNISPEVALLDFEEKKNNLEMLKKYKTDQLTEDQKISFEIFLWMLNHEVEGGDFLFHDYPVNQMFGVVQDLTALLTLFHKLEVTTDVENYFSRLSKIPEKFEQAEKTLNYQRKKGVIPPRFAIEKAIEMINKFISSPPNQNVFYLHLANRIEKIEIPNKKEKLGQTAKILQESVYPAYQKFGNYLSQFLKEIKGNKGVWALPEGEKYYDYMLKHHTTTNLTADEIHQIGLKEVERIDKEMRSLLAAEGIVNPQKSSGELMLEASENESFYYPNSDEGRKECLEGFTAILERSRTELSPLFDIKPKSKVLIEAVPKHEEEGAAAAYYYPGSVDGSRPGVFYVNLRDMKEIPKFGMETLTVHESEPGHHFQIAIQNELQMPILRKMGGFTAYVEGWALYTEKLAYERGFYKTNFDKLGHLQDEMMRAVRLVVDTGIHQKKWTEERAINYMEKMTGMAHESVVTEIERYFVMPGQACAYKIGQLKILELREKAKKLLGEKFDIREFHNVVLRLGAAPLSVLEEVVDEYIRTSLVSKK